MYALVMLRDPQTGITTSCQVGQELVVGREESEAGETIVCSDPHVSRVHCLLTCQPNGQVLVVDRSSYGTYINGRQVSGQAFAKVGDEIVLGHRYSLQVHQGIDTDAATVASPSAEEPLTGLGAPEPRSRTQPGSPPPRSTPPPELIAGRYRIEGVLGEGGMGVVYLAQDGKKDQKCAIKVLRACVKGTRHDEALRRFEREAKLTHKLRSHPGIVQVYDASAIRPSGQLYYVMEYVEGESLSTKIARGLGQREGAWLVAQVARSVAYAHEQDVIHRDLKPANVLVAKTGMVHLTDFGVARALDEEESRLTLSGAALGTPSYMAPEQIEDSKTAGPPADVYGLGAILYAVLTRRPPFKHKRLGRLIEAVQAGDRPSPRELVPEIHPELERICLRAMAVEIEQRWPSAAAMADELESWIDEQAGGETLPVG